MPNEEDVKNLDQKMDTVLKVLQEFGLNMIQNIGELKHILTVLTDKVEKLSDQTMYLKGLGIKFEEFGKFKEEINTELKYIQSMIKAGSFQKSATITSDFKSDSDKQTPEKILRTLQIKLPEINDIIKLISILDSTKEEIFTLVGGHPVLFELGSLIKNMKKEESINDSITNDLNEKIESWILRLKN